MARFVSSSRGKEMVIDELGFVYRLDRHNDGRKTSFWRCRDATCKARITTLRGSPVPISFLNLHSHDASSSQIQMCEKCGIRIAKAQFKSEFTFCEICKPQPSKDIIWERHIEFKCTICYESFPTHQSLSNHTINAHAPEKPVTCEICQKTCQDNIGLMDHIRLEHDKKKVPHMCDECVLPFRTETMLKNHQKLRICFSHKCDMCENVYQRVSDLKRHKDRKHANIRPHRCNKCDKDYQSIDDLKRHIKTKHPNIHHHQCNFCQKRFTSLLNLFEHQKSKHGVERPEESVKSPNREKAKENTCDTNNLLQSGSEDAKLYKCNECKKQFTMSFSLKCHIKLVHKKARPEAGKLNEEHSAKSSKQNGYEEGQAFECEVCKKQFRAKVSLNSHKILMHHSLGVIKKTGPEESKPFECEVCEKQFKTADALNIHRILIHNPQSKTEDTKNYECELCGKQFKTKVSLNCHGILVHEKSIETEEECIVVPF